MTNKQQSMKVTCYFSNGDELDYDLSNEAEAELMLGQIEFEFSIGERQVMIRRATEREEGDE